MSPHYYSSKARRGPRRLVSDYLRGVRVEFYTAPGMFSPGGVDEGTRLLIEYALVPEEGLLLDLGAGYGAIGITLAKAYPRLRVVMVEINPHAAKLARLNAKLNRVADRVEVRTGSLYQPVQGMRFTAILSNPPLAAGMRTVEEIIAKAPAHLAENGSLQLVMKKGAEKAINLMQQYFSDVKVLARKKGYTILYAGKPVTGRRG